MKTQEILQKESRSKVLHDLLDHFADKRRRILKDYPMYTSSAGPKGVKFRVDDGTVYNDEQFRKLFYLSNRADVGNVFLGGDWHVVPKTPENREILSKLAKIDKLIKNISNECDRLSARL